MSEKDTIAAQVRYDSSLHDRFEEFEEQRGFESRSEAVRTLMRAGLDEHDEEQEEHRAEARTSTSAEEWLQDRGRSWAGVGILSAVAFATTSTLFAANRFVFQIGPDWALPLAVVLSLFLFGVFFGGAVLAAVALRTGLVRRLQQSFFGSQEAEA